MLNFWSGFLTCFWCVFTAEVVAKYYFCYNNFVSDLISAFFCCLFLCEFKFPKFLGLCLVQIDFLNFLSFPLRCFHGVLQNMVTCFLRYFGSGLSPTVTPILFPNSPSSLSHKFLVPPLAASLPCGPLNDKENLPA